MQSCSWLGTITVPSQHTPNKLYVGCQRLATEFGFLIKQSTLKRLKVFGKRKFILGYIGFINFLEARIYLPPTHAIFRSLSQALFFLTKTLYCCQDDLVIPRKRTPQCPKDILCCLLRDISGVKKAGDIHSHTTEIPSLVCCVQKHIKRGRLSTVVAATFLTSQIALSLLLQFDV